MAISSVSPFARPTPGLRIKEGAPAPGRPSQEEASALADEARSLLRATREEQEQILSPQRGLIRDLGDATSLFDKGTGYNLDWAAGRHFFIAGGTGSGLGGALAAALLHAPHPVGSLTVVSRDLTRSLGYETGLAMQEYAEEHGLADRFHWINSGLALEGKDFEDIVSALKKVRAEEIIYANMVAAAYSGLLPGYPAVYVMDVDDEGLFQWRLAPLEKRSIEATRYLMGTLAVDFPKALDRVGISVAGSIFADWRGSLSRQTRDPGSPVYGRQGPYSTSLYLPKDIVQAYVSRMYGGRGIALDFFLPLMKTRALNLIPGGRALWRIYSTLLRRSGVRQISVPELALGVLHTTGIALRERNFNPFPRLDAHEAQFDLWFYELARRVNADEESEFCYRKWMELDQTAEACVQSSS